MPSARCAGCSRPSTGVARTDGQLAAPWWRTLLKLRFPAAVPFIAPALRLAGAASAVVGVVVSEISTRHSRRARSSDPVRTGKKRRAIRPKLYTAVLGAAVARVWSWLYLLPRSIGSLMRNRPPEATDVNAGRGTPQQRVEDLQPVQAQSESTRSSTSTSPCRPGEFVSLIGPSGCGKSHAAALDRRPHRADSRVDHGQRQVGTAGPPRSGLRHGVPAERSRSSGARSQRNIELPLELKGWDKAKRRARSGGDARTRQAHRLLGSTCRGSCRVACNSGSRSPAPWPRILRCC